MGQGEGPPELPAFLSHTHGDSSTEFIPFSATTGDKLKLHVRGGTPIRSALLEFYSDNHSEKFSESLCTMAYSRASFKLLQWR